MPAASAGGGQWATPDKSVGYTPHGGNSSPHIEGTNTSDIRWIYPAWWHICIIASPLNSR
jgi:hypothetical protein